MEPTAVIYEGTPGERLRSQHLTVLGAEASTVVSDARRLAAAGWTRIELCGGLDVTTAAAVRSAVPDTVRVGLNRYAFESLELVADYKRDFARGVVRPAAFLVPADVGADPVDHPDVTIWPVGSPDEAASVAAELADDGAGLIELYGGLGTVHAAAAVRGSGGRVPVGFVGYDD